MHKNDYFWFKKIFLILFMASKENRISQLSIDIRNQLKDDPEKLTQYEQILQKFATNQVNSSTLLHSLCALFQGNTKMINKISEALKNPILEENAVLSYFQLIQHIQKFSTSECNSQITHDKLELLQYLIAIVHLTLQEFIPLKFIKSKMKSIQNLLSQSFIQKVNEYMKQIAQSPHAVRIMINDMYLSANNSAVHNKYFVKSSIKPSSPMQLMAMTHLQIKSPVHLQSLIRCLMLFGFGFIDDRCTFDWINTIDPILANFFNNCQEANTPHLFHPSQIYKQIVESGMNEEQIQWVFGKVIIDLLSKSESINGENLMESASNSSSAAYLKKNLVGIEPSIPEMKCITFFQAMKIIINFIRINNSNLQGIEESLKAIYGDKAPLLNDIGNNVDFLLKFYGRCREFGGIAQKEFRAIIKQKLQTVDIQSKEWRFICWPLMKKSYWIRSIVLNGYKHKILPKKLETAVFYFLNPFVKRFESIAHSYTIFTQMLQTGNFFSLEGPALALIYYIELSKMIATNSQMNKKELEELASLVFSNEPPIQKYLGKTISHIDIVALNFVQCLHKLEKSEIKLANDTIEMIGFIHSEFIYQINITKTDYTISALPNYIYQ